MGRAANTHVANKQANATRRLNASTLRRSAWARNGSLILVIPIPSTSQSPACPRFHRPSCLEARRPTAKKSGAPMARRVSGVACVAIMVMAVAAVTPLIAVPATPRRFRSSSLMLTSCSAARERSFSRSFSLGTSVGSTSWVNTPYAIRLPWPGLKAFETTSATGDTSSSSCCESMTCPRIRARAEGMSCFVCKALRTGPSLSFTGPQPARLKAQTASMCNANKRLHR
mmetsp:Transcript_26022/g.60755  ORF Transcript_26022/g.60755 Transcript_26022/m.60755 type:complete len:228 (+) Transcript_26022:203-886(+)